MNRIVSGNQFLGVKDKFCKSVSVIAREKSQLHKTVLVDAALELIAMSKKGAEKEREALNYMKAAF